MFESVSQSGPGFPSPQISSSAGGDHVAILLCTYNGQDFIGEQLRSLVQQTHGNWSLHVSDDGSTDRTVDLVDGFAQSVADRHAVTVRRGPGRGAAANFMSLVTDTAIEADHFAFCDQDDVWYPDRIARGLAWLRAQPANVPALWGSRTEIVDRDLNHLGYSPLFRRPPSFQNALVQNIMGGNTMLMNRAARDLLAKAGILDVVMHDWWAYKLVTGAGGRVHYDAQPSLAYRQHDGNAIGANHTPVTSNVQRVARLFSGRIADMYAINLRALGSVTPLLTPQAVRVIASFQTCRSASAWVRPWCLLRSGVHRQTIKGTIALGITALFGKL